MSGTVGLCACANVAIYTPGGALSLAAPRLGWPSLPEPIEENGDNHFSKYASQLDVDHCSSYSEMSTAPVVQYVRHARSDRNALANTSSPV